VVSFIFTVDASRSGKVGAEVQPQIEMAGGGDIHIFAGADEEGNRRVVIADAPDQGAAVG
jgi:hypothetical protein